jgi:hypothetical protein
MVLGCLRLMDRISAWLGLNMARHVGLECMLCSKTFPIILNIYLFYFRAMPIIDITAQDHRRLDSYHLRLTSDIPRPLGSLD